jgi:hypothetical protein
MLATFSRFLSTSKTFVSGHNTMKAHHALAQLLVAVVGLASALTKNDICNRMTDSSAQDIKTVQAFDYYLVPENSSLANTTPIHVGRSSELPAILFCVRGRGPEGSVDQSNNQAWLCFQNIMNLPDCIKQGCVFTDFHGELIYKCGIQPQRNWVTNTITGEASDSMCETPNGDHFCVPEDKVLDDIVIRKQLSYLDFKGLNPTLIVAPDTLPDASSESGDQNSVASTNDYQDLKCAIGHSEPHTGQLFCTKQLDEVYTLPCMKKYCAVELKVVQNPLTTDNDIEVQLGLSCGKDVPNPVHTAVPVPTKRFTKFGDHETLALPDEHDLQGLKTLVYYLYGKNSVKDVDDKGLEWWGPIQVANANSDTIPWPFYCLYGSSPHDPKLGIQTDFFVCAADVEELPQWVDKVCIFGHNEDGQHEFKFDGSCVDKSFGNDVTNKKCNDKGRLAVPATIGGEYRRSFMYYIYKDPILREMDASAALKMTCALGPDSTLDNWGPKRFLVCSNKELKKCLNIGMTFSPSASHNIARPQRSNW